MKLHQSKRAPNPRRVRWFMAEKGIEDIEIVEIDIFGGDHRTPAYLAMAGLPHVPALELDDGTGITESIAICRYLEHLHPEPNMFGKTPLENAVIEMWTRRAEMLVATPLMLSVRHSHPRRAAAIAREVEPRIGGEIGREEAFVVAPHTAQPGHDDGRQRLPSRLSRSSPSR
jgi:glutathione S-transferase